MSNGEAHAAGRPRIRDSAITVGLAVGNMAVGLLIQGWLAARLGTGSAANVFQTGITVPTLLASVMFAAVPTALIPILVSPKTSTSHRLAHRETALLVGSCAAIAGAVAAFGSQAATAIGPGLSSSEHADLAAFLRITAVCLPISALCAIAQSQLHASRRFGIVGAGGLVNGIGLGVSAALLGYPRLSVRDLAWAVAAGYLLQLAWMTPGLVAGRFGPATSLGRRRVIGPITLLAGGYAFIKLQPLIERALAGGLGTGTVAEIGYASKVHQALVLVSTFGVGVVAFPSLAADLRRGDRRSAMRLLNESLEFTLVFSLVSCIAAITAARPAVTVMFARGEFEASSIAPVANLIRVSVPTVLFVTVASPLVALLYAAHLRRRVMVTGAIAITVGTVASVILREPWGAYGVLAGSGVSAAIALMGHVHNAQRVLPEWAPRAVSVRFLARARRALPLLAAAPALLAWNELGLESGRTARFSAPWIHLAVSGALLLALSAPLLSGALRRSHVTRWEGDQMDAATMDYAPEDAG